jgi:hypothetical protein
MNRKKEKTTADNPKGKALAADWRGFSLLKPKP